ncbi:hypothetical protein LCGC14_2586820 [marine sediment metagenome]|uniref:Uncharacterized protein n=1 Tax=marine sediment metagenome TaxID=412755 RepID=A0A0F9D5K8_9ZZZZ
MIPKEVSSKILHDAERDLDGIISFYVEARQRVVDAGLSIEGERGTKLRLRNKLLKEILALSGTTDIECPDEATGDPDFATKTRYKWKVSVTLENGGGTLNLDGQPTLSRERCLVLANLLGKTEGVIAQIYAEVQRDYAGYVQEVRQVVE